MFKFLTNSLKAIMPHFNRASRTPQKGSARGTWDPRKGQQPFRPNPNGVGDRNTTLKRLLIGASFARLSLPLTEVMKIARLTSPLLDAPRQSSPWTRLRHGRRLALLFHLNLCTFFFALSLALLTRLPPPLTSPTVLLPGIRLRSMPLT